MNCTTCGNQLNENAKFCPVCGSPVIGKPVYSPNAAFYQQPNYPPYPSQQAPRKSNTKVIILCVVIGILVIATAILGYNVYKNETKSTEEKLRDAGSSLIYDLFDNDDDDYDDDYDDDDSLW